MPRTIHSISRMNSEWHLSGLAINRPTQNRNISKLFALIFQSLGLHDPMNHLSCIPTESRLPCIRTIVLSMKTTELPTDTNTAKHQFAVQDLPAEPSRYSLLCRSLVSTFSCKTVQGISAVFSSRRLLDLSRQGHLASCASATCLHPSIMQPENT